MTEIPKHDSMRGEFAYQLYQKMLVNKDVWLLTADLGWGMWDHVMRDFPERAISVGAAEQSMLGIAVGLALEGKVPFTYTISSFYLRAAETIGLYLHNEQVSVKLVGSGRDNDYRHDGPSHDATLAQNYLGSLNLEQHYPQTKEEIPDMVEEMIKNGKPSFISLKR